MGFTQHSIFGDFDDVNVDYKVYFSDVPSPILLDDLRKAPWHMRPMVEFELDAALGNLPRFSWLDPRYFSIGEFEESDQHPGNPIFGGYLMTDSVKNGERSSACTRRCLISRCSRRKAIVWCDGCTRC
jgi:hypothetical protein